MESPLILSQFSVIVLMVEGSAINVCHQPDGFCVIWMSILEEIGNTGFDAVSSYRILSSPYNTEVGLWIWG